MKTITHFAQPEAAQTTNKLQFFIHLISPIGQTIHIENASKSSHKNSFLIFPMWRVVFMIE